MEPGGGWDQPGGDPSPASHELRGRGKGLLCCEFAGVKAGFALEDAVAS